VAAIEAMGAEIRRRLGGGPAHFRLVGDAEVWVDPAVWERTVEQMVAAVVGLHEAALPPRSAGSVRVSATAVLFSVEEVAPPNPSGDFRG
jgi:hypothetical protein